MKNFIQLLIPPENFTGQSIILVYHDMEILVEKDEDGNPIPEYKKIRDYYDLSDLPVPIGIMKGVYYSALNVDDKMEIPENTKFMNVRHLYRTTNEDLFYLAGLGRQISDWNTTFRFCGKCGSRTASHTDERVKICSNCGHSVYPKISPAMICSVTRGPEILLARGSKFTQPVYSVLAGFVEPGETLEETVEREVMEETGISVKNIMYFGSQPWPFSSSMMIAFTAEYDYGEIKIDDKEILDAGWFTPDNLPMLPTPYSIARRLIMNFVEKSS
ncbi:MAG: NAD(+) diphosphatase [Spirochaetia bacterium]|jgi:NAD+ diphosphatase|nr:NAD(+) diphosphatase [Spirochaetia bacterium]